MTGAFRVRIMPFLFLAGVLAVGQLQPVDAADNAAPPSHRLDPAAVARLIDQAIQQRLTAEKAVSAAPADDAEFLRRVCLDITGIIPPADKVQAFLDSKEPAKRARLIEELLASPQYGQHMADLWQDLLLPPRESFAKGLKVEPLITWLAQEFNSNKPWNQMTAELLTATGSQQENGATTFFLANRSPDKLTDTVCRVFLGMQLQCAQCHNHPFTGWKRTEYWGLAAFFAKVDDGGGKKLNKGGPLNVREARTVQTKRLPDSSLNAQPQFLDGKAPTLQSSDPYRPALAQWLTARENPYFARAMVNRIWAQFFGRGLVNPVDNLHEDNPPSHPELYDALTRQFIASGFDVKELIRGVCLSQAYQRSSTPPSAASRDQAPYAVMALKPLTPEQLYDSLATVLGPPDAAAKRDRKARKQGGGGGSRSAFVDFFHPGEGADPNDYSAGIPQVLRLMNSEWTGKVTAFATQLARSGQAPAQNIDRLFLVTLSRRPTSVEKQRVEHYLQSNSGQPAQAYSDILWALVNSSEFTLNH